MLAYLTVDLLLYTPMRALIVSLAAAVAGGAFGWLRFRRQIAEAWTRVAARETSGGQHAYRGPLRTDSIQRPPVVVIAAALMGYALVPGHAGWLAVAADEASIGRGWHALLALGFLGIGAWTAHATHRLVTGGPGAWPALQRRAVAAGAAGLAAYGALAVFLAAVMLGAFDERAVELRGIKGFTDPKSLGEIRSLVAEHPLFDHAEGRLVAIWYVLGVWAFAHATASIVHASLLLLLARAARDASEEGAAPRLPWHRRWWWAFPGAGGVMAVLGGGLFVTRCVPVITTKVVYAEIRPVCSLPDLPAEASDLRGRHRVDFMSEDAFVQFRVSDPEGYAAPLLAAGYTEVKPPERGGLARGPASGEPAKSVRHYRHHREYSRQPDVIDAATLCDVHVDPANGLVRVWMWAGD